ncbi:MAG TPA: PA0069 family radical SAM protein [Patescibacteria group bacterium]|nr:PA0069 family radical SAM protein [Patescibacteria group bacterium]
MKVRGRGALSNRAGRFERFRIEPAEDVDPGPPAGDGAPPGDGAVSPDDEPPPLRTTVTPERTRTIISRNDSPDLPFDRSINPYRGCEHGCVYCFARPTHAYLGLSPGLDFESRLFSKPDAARLLREELRRPDYRCATLALGSNTDPYQPIERRLGITRSVLEVLAEHRHPVSVVTKSELVLRDADLLGEMARQRLAVVKISITTLDRRLARTMEPRAAAPARRLETIRALSAAGIPAGVLSSPMIPGLNDSELETILAAAAGAGARSAGYVLLRLPHEIKDLFGEWLATHEPLKAPRVLALLRSMRGGALYDASFGTRMRGEGPHAALLRKRYEIACRRNGLLMHTAPLDTSRFRVPPRAGDQPGLFEPRTDR